MVTPVCVISCPGNVSSQLPPVSAARSTITDPGRIDSTADAGISRGAGRPGTAAVVIDDVEVRDPLLQRRLLRPLLLLRQLARVSTLGLLAATPRSRNDAPSDSTCSATAGRTSNAETTAR